MLLPCQRKNVRRMLFSPLFRVFPVVPDIKNIKCGIKTWVYPVIYGLSAIFLLFFQARRHVSFVNLLLNFAISCWTKLLCSDKLHKLHRLKYGPCYPGCLQFWGHINTKKICVVQYPTRFGQGLVEDIIVVFYIFYSQLSHLKAFLYIPINAHCCLNIFVSNHSLNNKWASLIFRPKW